MSRQSHTRQPPNAGGRCRTPRVAMIASSLRRGGAEKQTVYLARALHEAGVDIRFYHLGNGGPYASVLQDKGIPVSQFHIPNNPWNILTRLIGELSRWRPHIVFTNQFGDLRFGAIAGRICGALTLGGIRSDGHYELNAHGSLSEWLVRLTHGLIANSFQAKRNLVSRGIKQQTIEVIPNVIDLREFDDHSGLQSGLDLPSDRIIVAAVGSLQPCKRFDRFVEALALARRQAPALAGVIAGPDYGTEGALKAQASKLGLRPPHLTFLGECDQIPVLLSRCSLFALTSEYEGFPNVILEAMAARLPVITTPAGDSSLIVQHGRTGYVVESDDTSQMASFMLELAGSPSLRSALGAAGRKRVEAEFNRSILSDRLLATLHEFAARARKTFLREALEPSVSAIGEDALGRARVIERSAA